MWILHSNQSNPANHSDSTNPARPSSTLIGCHSRAEPIKRVLRMSYKMVKMDTFEFSHLSNAAEITKIKNSNLWAGAEGRLFPFTATKRK